jgi:hypothetical protein
MYCCIAALLYNQFLGVICHLFTNNIFAVIIDEMKNLEHTDKRTGIVYTSVVQPVINTPDSNTQPHLDAFIPSKFLKSYFGKPA